MEESIGTVLFNGQFWIYLLEKIDHNNELFVGKYTFGSEPTNTELIDFYLYSLPFLQVYKSEIKIRQKAKKSIKEQERITSKAKNIFKELQKKKMEEQQKKMKILDKKNEKEKYLLRIEKKKEKHKGH